MERYTIPKTHWKRAWRGTAAQTALVKCPDCGQVCSLAHEIKANGEVNPSLGCPNKQCSFHHYVTLEAWPDGGLLE